MEVYDILLRPLLAEKDHMRKHEGYYTFKVHPDANKAQIKEAIQKLFKVTVVSVNTMRVHGKVRRYGRTYGRRPDWKKAIIRVKPGENISALESL